MNDQADFYQIYPLILQENLRGALDLLASLPDSELTEEQLTTKQKFQERFDTHNEVWQEMSGDALANQIAATFRQYWQVVLLDADALASANVELENTMIDLLIDHGYLDSGIPRDLIFQDLYTHVNTFLREQGLYANAMGKTGSFYDLFLWTEQTEKDYTIQLPETETTVKVVFMDGFISNGWAHYATLGKNYAAGWARGDALYCVKSAYDLSAESFQVSYLSHEAQHFVDYQSFPALQQADLEYRAKLAELSLAKIITHDLVGKFIARAKNDSRVAHPFANYCVVRDLSRALFGEDFVSDGARWAEISADKINETSQQLIRDQSVSLKQVGAEDVTDFIR